MRYVLSVVVVSIALFSFSCTPKPACELAKIGTSIVSEKIAARWACDSGKVYAFLVKPVNEQLCKKDISDKDPSAILKILCPIVIGTVVDLGVDKIASEFSCDKAKVEADLSQASQICSKL